MKRLQARCPELDLTALGSIGGTDDEGTTLKVREAGDLVTVEWRQSAGEGGPVDTRWHVYDARACRGTLVAAQDTGGLWTDVRVEPEGAERAGGSLRSLLGDRPDCSDPKHGFACMVVRAYDRSCPDVLRPAGRRWDLVPLFDVAGPWLAGPPTRQTATYWTPDEMTRVRGAPVTPEVTQGHTLPALAAPGRVRAASGRYRLFQTAHLPAKGPGFAFAVEDTRTRQHRWVGHTRACLLGDQVEWLLFGDDLAVGHAVYAPREPTRMGIDGLFVLDLREGPLYRLVADELVALLAVDPARPALSQDLAFGDEGRAAVELAAGALRLAEDLQISTAELRRRITELRGSSP